MPQNPNASFLFTLALVPVAVLLAPVLWVAAIALTASGAGHAEAGI